MIRHQVLELLGDEPSSYDRLRFVYTSPTESGEPWLKLPNTYDLEDVSSYFTTDINVRHENLLTRSNWAMAFKSSQVNPGRRAGDDPSRPTGGNDEEAAPRQPKGKGRGDRQSGSKLIGAPLTRQENGRSHDHRPQSPSSGRFICWDNSCWIGCNRANCPHSHKVIGKLNQLDRSIQMQLLRRGGVKYTPSSATLARPTKR